MNNSTTSINYDNLPLVSIIVVTYNSSKTVLETLDSIKAQTYRKIELIISDDCSTDNSLEICRRWIDNNKNRFVYTEIVTTASNTGTSGNLNRGVRKCKGSWVKDIAGDDRLLPICIQENINYILRNPNADIVFSKVRLFGNDCFVNDYKSLFSYHYFDLPHDKFYKKLIHRDFLPGSSSFIRMSVFDKIGLYDETIPLMEDWPFWMKAFHKGCIFAFNDVETVEYRLEGSVSITNTKSKKYLECEKAAFKLSLQYQKELSIWMWMRSIIEDKVYKLMTIFRL